jgi:nicotinamide mononucleotide (NMN) deamidase PncC
VRRIFGDTLFAEGKQDLAALVVERLVARRERFAFAESAPAGSWQRP